MHLQFINMLYRTMSGLRSKPNSEYRVNSEYIKILRTRSYIFRIKWRIINNYQSKLEFYISYLNKIIFHISIVKSMLLKLSAGFILRNIFNDNAISKPRC